MDPNGPRSIPEGPHWVPGRPVTDLNGSRWTTTDPFRTPEDPQSNTLFNLANLAIFSKSRQDQQKISLKSISKLLWPHCIAWGAGRKTQHSIINSLIMDMLPVVHVRDPLWTSYLIAKWTMYPISFSQLQEAINTGCPISLNFNYSFALGLQQFQNFCCPWNVEKNELKSSS